MGQQRTKRVGKWNYFHFGVTEYYDRFKKKIDGYRIKKENRKHKRLLNSEAMK